VLFRSSKVKHDNIVRYIDSFEEGNSFFLVEEYVEGENLGDKYYNNPSSEDEAMSHILQLLNAVQYLHNNQIKHRDINPNNLILLPERKLVLIDFGTAKYFRRGRRETQGVPKSTIVGTPYYAPPEQWEGDTSEVSDIFSIGRTMYFILTGERPPDSPYKRLDFQGKKISKKLADFVIKASEPEVKDRFSTVVEMIRYLNAIKIGKSEDLTKDVIKVKLIVGANSYPLEVYATIGSHRYRMANILIPDPDPKGPYIEKIHAVIRKENEKYWIYDNSSRFGTFVEEAGRKILITPRKDVIQYLKDRGYIPPQSILEKKLLKDGDFISLAWDPILGDYIKMQFRELS
jgi:serine/threonine protein kinase